MTATFTKLFQSITASTIWCESDGTRIVWITMLAMADRNGEVAGSIPGLAGIARVSVEDCRKAIKTFLAPDPDSRTKEFEGRRIEEIPGGWRLLNYELYRKMQDAESAKEAKRKWWRENRSKSALDQQLDNASESRSDSMQAEAEAEAEAENKHSLSITESGAACLAMRKHIPTVNPSDPRLKALIQAGATTEEFEYAAQKAIGKANAFAYALKIVESRRHEAASIAANPGKSPTKPMTEKQQAIAKLLGSRAPGAKKERIING